MTTDFPTAPPAYGLEGPSAGSTVEKSHTASHTEFLTLPDCMATFTYGDTTSDPKNFSTIKMDNQESLSFVCNRSTGGTCTFTVKGDELWASYSNPSGGNNSGVFKKQQ